MAFNSSPGETISPLIAAVDRVRRRAAVAHAVRADELGDGRQAKAVAEAPPLPIDPGRAIGFGSGPIAGLDRDGRLHHDLGEPADLAGLAELALVIAADDQVGGPGADLDVAIEARVFPVAGRQFHAEDQACRHVLGETGIDAHHLHVAERGVTEGVHVAPADIGVEQPVGQRNLDHHAPVSVDHVLPADVEEVGADTFVIVVPGQLSPGRGGVLHLVHVTGSGRRTVSPVPSGNRLSVPTSNTPHPQAHALAGEEAKLGARTRRKEGGGDENSAQAQGGRAQGSWKTWHGLVVIR